MKKITAAIRRRAKFVHWPVYFILGFMCTEAWIHMPRFPAILFTAYAVLHVLFLHLITWQSRTSEDMWKWYHEQTNDQWAWHRSRIKEVFADVEKWRKEHGDGEEWKRQ